MDDWWASYWFIVLLAALIVKLIFWVVVCACFRKKRIRGRGQVGNKQVDTFGEMFCKIYTEFLSFRTCPTRYMGQPSHRLTTVSTTQHINQDQDITTCQDITTHQDIATN